MQLIFLFVGASSAATYVVGTDASSISEAISAASDGDTIEVPAGTWYDCIDFGGKSLTIQGDGSGTTTLDGAGVCETLVVLNSDETAAYLEGFTLANSGKAIVEFDVQDAAFSDVSVSPTQSTTAPISVQAGVVTWSVGDWDSVDSDEYTTAFVASGAELLVEDVDINDSSLAFSLETGASLDMTRVSTLDCWQVVGDPDGGVTVTSSDSVFDSGAIGWKLLEGSVGSSSGDTFSNFSTVAIRLEDSQSLLVDGSSFEDNVGGQAALSISKDAEVTILNSTFIGNSADSGGGAIYTGSTSGRYLTIEDTVFEDNQLAVAVQGLVGRNLTFTNNTSGDTGASALLLSTRGSELYDLTMTGNEGVALNYKSGNQTHEFVIDGCEISGSPYGISMGVSFAAVEISDCEFSDLSGYAIKSNDDWDLVLDASTFERIGGYAISIPGDIAISNSAFRENNSTSTLVSAGGRGSSITISDSWFSDNNSTGDWIVDSDFMEVSSTVMDGNSATYGIVSAGVLDVSNSFWCGNEGLGVSSSEVLITNSVFANELYDLEYTGGFSVGSYDTESTIQNSAFIGNQTSNTSALYLGGDVDVVNTVFAYTDGYAVSASADGSLAPTYNLWWDNDPDHGDGLVVPVTGFGNVEQDPLFESWSDDGDCWNDNLLPAAGSPLVDAGDPTVFDADGSRSDIGAFGGPNAAWVDADGDGWLAPWDCDDENAELSPLTVEICDGVDQDCDGLVDEDATDLGSFYLDDDGDGYGDPASTLDACERPDGYVDNSDDCDDSDASKAIPEEEVPYDGVDQDCDGADLTDVDEDGYDAVEAGGEDCDDEDPDVLPEDCVWDSTPTVDSSPADSEPPREEQASGGCRSKGRGSAGAAFFLLGLGLLRRRRGALS